MQHVDDRPNLIIPSTTPYNPPLPPHVDDLKFASDARQSNENSTAASIGAHSFANKTTSQSDNVPSSDSLSGSVVLADYTLVTMRRNCIFQNKKLLQYHLHHDATSKHYQFKVKRSNSTLLHVICIDMERSPWQLHATRMRGSELFVVKRYDDVHTCVIEIVQGHYRQAKSWMIGECVKVKYLDPTNTSYRPREIMRDMQSEFGVSFNYLRTWRGKEVALTSLRGNDAESYNVLPAWAEMVKWKNPGSNIDIETDSANCLQCFYLCLAASKHANLKTKYKDFKGPLKTYFDGRSYEVVASIFQRSEVRNHDNQHCGVIEQCGLESQALKLTSKLAPKAEKLLRTNFSIGLIVTPRPADQFEYAVTNNVSQIWIVDMSERTSQMAGIFLKKSGRKLSILPKQSVGPKGHGFEGFCHKEKNMSLFGVGDVMVMDTTDKPVPIQYP
ncbi:hypothetical protein TIFTF001_038230 [Ficus carica]|uniref:Uncharacterized protein n=1 Tax=Ficus carica TaxID=3494 RepID=A0AA88E7D5_FICCA|nr:hypothetical protein TIFTF001_038219 [Ficus carica]GMN69176.1 hypothetical protein TIFTF001_038230 [Ficus carica]